MTVSDLYRRSCALLEEAEVPDARTDAALLLETFCGVTRAMLYAEPDREPDPEQVHAFLEGVQRRAAREPLQHITEEQIFCGLPFRVTADVLCPRQETELLVEEALRILKEERTAFDRNTGRTPNAADPGGTEERELSHTDTHAKQILDLCTGSGCILVSLLAMDETLTGTGSDISAAALALARRNAERNGVAKRCRLVQSDLFALVEGTYDLIATNPPYIPTGDIPGLMEEVRDHEPHLALDGGADGLDFYRRIAREAQGYLKPGGHLIAEIGWDQGGQVQALFAANGLEEIRIKKDLAGLDRVVIGRKRRV